MTSDLREIAKAYYRAYERLDRSFMEENLAPDFTFTSPFDDHIDRAAYFNRCWPKQPLHQKFDFVTVMQEGDRVFVAYDCTMHIPNTTHPEARFRNAELMTFERAKLKNVEVFFGDPPRGLSRREFAVQSGAG
jgi:ketosteroid isomerase-like protein